MNTKILKISGFVNVWNGDTTVLDAFSDRNRDELKNIFQNCEFVPQVRGVSGRLEMLGTAAYVPNDMKVTIAGIKASFPIDIQFTVEDNGEDFTKFAHNFNLHFNGEPRMTVI